MRPECPVKIQLENLLKAALWAPTFWAVSFCHFSPWIYPSRKKYGCTCHFNIHFNIASPTGKPQEQNSRHKIKFHNWKPKKPKKPKKQKKNKKKTRIPEKGWGIIVAGSLFFLFFQGFFFLVFQGFSNAFLVLVTFSHLHLFLAVRCLHAFKLAGTNRLTTAAMNILGLRIKTVCSNFEMFGHVIMTLVLCYTFGKMLHKLVAHFAEVIRPSSQALLYCIIDGICCRLMLHFLGGMLHRFAKKLFTFKSRCTYTHIYIYIQCVHLQRKAFLDWHWFYTVCSNITFFQANAALVWKRCCI